MPSVTDILSPGGPISGLLSGQHEARPEQVRMAEAVVRAMASKSHLIAEAGTGVGKSFAYLVPAMLRCLAGETVVIATHTIALQEQLINKDIPLLMKAFGLDMPAGTPGVGAGPRESDPEEDEDPYENVEFDEDGVPFVVDKRRVGDDDTGTNITPPKPGIRPILVKGRGNYLSSRRLKLASERQDRLFSDPIARRSLHAIEEWAYKTDDGTLSTLPQLERTSVWDKVKSDSGNCMGRKCPTFVQCFYQRARRKMEGSNLLICNHALFFADLALRSQNVSILPTYNHVVLDEAHNVEEVAGEHFGVKLSEYRVNFLLSSLYHPRTQRGQLSSLLTTAGDLNALDRATALVVKAQDISRAFFETPVSYTHLTLPTNREV